MEGSGSVQIITDPVPGGPKNSSETQVKTNHTAKTVYNDVGLVCLFPVGLDQAARGNQTKHPAPASIAWTYNVYSWSVIVVEIRNLRIRTGFSFLLSSMCYQEDSVADPDSGSDAFIPLDPG
jgi:hypothetical protein